MDWRTSPCGGRDSWLSFWEGSKGNVVSKRSAEIIPLDSKKFRCLRKPLGRSGAGEFRFPVRVANRPTVHCCCGTHFARRCPRSWGTKGAAQQSVDGPSDCSSPTRTESSVAQASRNFSKNRVDVSAGNAPPRRSVCKTSCLSIVMASSYLAMFDHDQPNLPRRRGGPPAFGGHSLAAWSVLPSLLQCQSGSASLRLRASLLARCSAPKGACHSRSLAESPIAVDSSSLAWRFVLQLREEPGSNLVRYRGGRVLTTMSCR